MSGRRALWRRDLLVAVAVTAVAEVELVLVTAGSQVPTGSALGTLLTLPALTLRRAMPLLAAAVAAVGFALPMSAGEQPGVATPFLALLFLLASVGWYAALRPGLAGTGLVLAGGLGPQLWNGTTTAADAVVNSVLIVGTWAVGHALRRTTDRRVAAEVAADRAAHQAVAAERARIARDLHDSMAHALTLITLQAGGARERATEPVTRDLLGGLEATARGALADLHRLLRLGGRAGDEALGVAALRDLVTTVRGSDLDVDLQVDLPDTVPGTVSTTVYRVVQEGLTNVVRHSDATGARVEVKQERSGTVLIVVENNGRTRPAHMQGTGAGLRGLQERVGLLGGALQYGPCAYDALGRGADADEGWRLEARIPWTTA